jgi:hypothetical protein
MVTSPQVSWLFFKDRWGQAFIYDFRRPGTAFSA